MDFEGSAFVEVLLVLLGQVVTAVVFVLQFQLSHNFGCDGGRLSCTRLVFGLEFVTSITDDHLPYRDRDKAKAVPKC